MDLLGCYSKEMQSLPVKNCSDFKRHNLSSFQECVAQYDNETFDNFMLFFGQIEPICQYLNDTRPQISAEIFIEVSFEVASLSLVHLIIF